MNDINRLIQVALQLHTEKEYLNGGCYAFAKAASVLFDGEVYVNREKEHCVVNINGTMYDITGQIKDVSGYHPFRPKEEQTILNEYHLVSPLYTAPLINSIIEGYEKCQK